METVRLNTFFNSNYLPWKLPSHEMLPSILLMNKMLFILLVFNGFYFLINDPYIPFISSLDLFNKYPNLFKYTLRICFVLFGTTLLLNIKTKLSSISLGLVIFLALLASKIIFRNHIFIVGCVFFISGLISNKGLPWLLIIQMSIIYIGTSVNKIFEIDWWTGQFMHNWLAIALENPIYIFISNLLPTLLFAKLLSWSVILVEFLIGVFVLTKKWRTLSIWMIIIFHFALFTIVHEKFGHFLQDLFIVLIAFLAWPQQKIKVKYQLNKRTRLLKALDWSGTFSYEEHTTKNNNWLEVEHNGTLKINTEGFKSILMFSSGFYMILFLVDLLESYLISLTDVSLFKISVHLIYCLFIWSLILIFIPIKLKNGKINTNSK